MFIVYDKTGLCHYWLFNFQSPLICVFNAPPVLWHMFSVSAWVKSSQKGWEIGFPFAGWGNDDKVPLLLSSINFVISHSSSFFIPRWKSPLWTQFRFLSWLVHPVLAPGHSLGLDQYLLRPFSFLLWLSPSADHCKGSPGEHRFDESTFVALGHWSSGEPPYRCGHTHFTQLSIL